MENSLAPGQESSVPPRIRFSFEEHWFDRGLREWGPKRVAFHCVRGGIFALLGIAAYWVFKKGWTEDGWTAVSDTVVQCLAFSVVAGALFEAGTLLLRCAKAPHEQRREAILACVAFEARLSVIEEVKEEARKRADLAEQLSKMVQERAHESAAASRTPEQIAAETRKEAVLEAVKAAFEDAFLEATDPDVNKHRSRGGSPFDEWCDDWQKRLVRALSTCVKQSSKYEELRKIFFCNEDGPHAKRIYIIQHGRPVVQTLTADDIRSAVSPSFEWTSL
jgi:hypothetical protein